MNTTVSGMYDRKFGNVGILDGFNLARDTTHFRLETNISGFIVGYYISYRSNNQQPIIPFMNSIKD